MLDKRFSIDEFRVHPKGQAFDEALKSTPPRGGAWDSDNAADPTQSREDCGNSASIPGSATLLTTSLHIILRKRGAYH